MLSVYHSMLKMTILKIILLLISVYKITCFNDCIYNLKLNGEDLQFDLSRLNETRSVNFTISESDYSVKISLCSAEEQKTKCDGIYSIICLVEKKKKFTSIGSKIKDVKLNSKNQLFMSLESYKNCADNQKFTTEVTFICDKNNRDNIQYRKNTNKCKYVLEWWTEAACLVDDLNVRKVCQKPIPSIHYKFNLNSLRRIKENYLVENDGRRFQLNICGRLLNGNKCGGNITTICDISDENASKVFAVGHYSNSDIVYDEINNNLKLIQHERISKRKKNKRIEILFKCDENIQPENVVPKFLKHDITQNIAHFEVVTAAVCVPKMEACEVFTSTSNFNLKPLHKRFGNWIIPNEKFGGNFYINVCDSLNTYDQKIPLKCIENIKTSACYVNKLGNVFPIGSYQYGPHLINNTLQINFTNGASCGNLKWSSVINFVCSRENETQILHISTNESLCTNLFLWKTPNACPVLFRKQGKCIGSHPHFSGIIYNITSLKGSQFEYNDITDNSIYHLSICSPLDIPCNGYTDSGACWSIGNKEINIGISTENIISESGKVSLIMHGESCFHKGPTSITIIKFVCDYLNSHKIHFLKKDLYNCIFEFKLYTKDVCTNSLKSQNCTVKDDLGNVYDFSSLTKFDQNYEVNFDGKRKIIINICHSIINNGIDGANCQPSSGICLVDNEQLLDSNKYKNLGNVAENLQIENNSIFMEMKNGFYNGLYVSSKIEFHCSSFNEDPVFSGKRNDTFFFHWSTPLACQKKSKIIRDILIQDNLINQQVYNPNYSINIVGTKYDIIVCHNKFISSSGHNIFKNDLCNTNDPTIRIFLKVNKEIYSYYLDHKYPSIIHVHNDTSSGLNISEKILFKFKCGFLALTPSILKEKTFIKVLIIDPTFCDKKLECKIDNYDVTALKNTYVIKSQLITYYIYMCSYSFQGISGLMEMNNKNYSLGHQTTIPKINDIGFYEILFDDGDNCMKDKSNLKYSSKILFECDDSVAKGYPQYVQNNNCQVEFIWRTSFVCNLKKVEFEKSTCSAIVDKGYDENIISKKMLNMSFLNRKKFKEYGVQFCSDSLCENNFECISYIDLNYDINYKLLIVKLILNNNSTNYTNIRIILACLNSSTLINPIISKGFSSLIIYDHSEQVCCLDLNSNINYDSKCLNKTHENIFDKQLKIKQEKSFPSDANIISTEEIETESHFYRTSCTWLILFLFFVFLNWLYRYKILKLIRILLRQHTIKRRGRRWSSISYED
ncbi:cation-independent mannose-6-phosphate receptor isoform X3 [Daktulosphaira vitifoliae]|uniref:cation-independent mannose-6-phosphate receptor isoform X3 n=1 Tax=Daktulosphaira vitifoliae TaxID=58002 RepID=UPI0021AAE70D|nr:cation-independent mannose-6-phosphate receptor isoform X3 [Daktulosphaira vitifoliae]